MSKTLKLSLMAATANGALLTFLKPKLAQDAKIDLTEALDGVTVENFKARRPAMAEAVKKAVTGKLAKDAKLDGLDDVLLALDATTEANAAMPEAGKAKDGKMSRDDVKEMLKEKLSEDEFKAACDYMPDDDEEDQPGALDEDKDKEDDEEKAAKDKKAMDTALRVAATTTAKEVRASERAIREAERAVRPYVGEIDMTFDSAEDVYRRALEMLNVPEAKTIHASALPTILGMQKKPGARPVETDTGLTMDAAAMTRATEIAPGFAHIKVGL